MNASFHPAARKELLESIAYYQAEGLELGERLFTEVERRIRQAARFPLSGAPVLGLEEVYDVRQLTLRSFPFIIITAILREELIVVALAHTGLNNHSVPKAANDA